MTALTVINTASAIATSSTSDEQLLGSWLASLNSPQSRRNFAQTGKRFLACLPGGIRSATVEEVRQAISTIVADVKESSARQYVLRIKSLLSYAHDLGYTRFNAGTTIKVRSEGNRGAVLAKRIISEAAVALLIRFTGNARDRVMLQVAYAGGLRVSEIIGLSWGDIIRRENLLQLTVAGKGGQVRNILLPEAVSEALESLRGEAAPGAPVFVSRLGERLAARSVHAMVKRSVRRAGLHRAISPHWLRHAHGSHALDRGASLAEVKETLGHANVSTTSGYLHARPHSSSGLRLDPGVFNIQPIEEEAAGEATRYNL